MRPAQVKSAEGVWLVGLRTMVTDRPKTFVTVTRGGRSNATCLGQVVQQGNTSGTVGWRLTFFPQQHSTHQS